MRTGRIPIIILAAVFVFSSCSSRKSDIIKPAEVVQQTSEVPQPRQSSDMPKLQQPADVPKLQQPQTPVVTKHQPPVPPLRRKVISLLDKKKYRQALELMSGRKHEGMEKELVQAINGLLEVGDDAFSLGNYATAGRAFKTVLDAYPAEPSLRDRISHDQKQLRSSLESCANRLMEQGLEEYRRGRLESAVRTWKSVLAISPGHQQAKKSLDTATVQLQELHNLKKR